MQKGMGAYLGLVDDETLGLVHELERVCRSHGRARTQMALASALWRATSSHPSHAAQSDFDLDAIVLTEGGRRLRAEVIIFPPRGEGPLRAPEPVETDDSPGGPPGDGQP